MGLRNASDEASTSASSFLSFIWQGEISGYLRFHKEAVMMSDEVDASPALGHCGCRTRAASSERGEPKLDKSMRGGLSAAPSLAVDC